MILSHPLETDRLLIRRFEAGDEQAVAAYATDPAVMTYIERGVMTESQVQAFIETETGDEPEAFPVILKGTGKLIGHLIFHPWFAPRTYEIGWALHPSHQRQGYAPEAARALLHHGFTALQAHRIIATCQPENYASYRVMEKIGMRREGHFRQCLHRGGELWWDEYFYAILAEEWGRGDGSANHPERAT